MAIAETATLMSELGLNTRKFDAGVVKANRGLKSMESTAFKVGENIGTGLNRAAKNIKKIATVGVVALAGAVALGVKSLADLQRTENQTAAAIESTGGKAKVSAEQVRTYAENLENLSTVDDKVIQDGENLLLTFTNIGSKTFPTATKAALDMALALANGNVEAVDLKASSLALGKALNDPAAGFAALKRSGVSFTAEQIKTLKGTNALTKSQEKQYAKLQKSDKAAAKRFLATAKANNLLKSQNLILAEVNKEFGKSSEAAGKGPEAVMRRLADAGENVSQILARATLPVLERLGKFLTDKLNDPAFLTAVDEFGRKLGEAGGKFLDFVEKVDFKAIGAALRVGADFAGKIVGAFLSAPLWLQEAIVTGWGLNKLTGGAVTGIFGELASGLIKGVLGINAGVVNINAASVAGAGALPGLAGAGAGAAGVSVAQLIPFAGLAVIGTAAGQAAAEEVNKDRGTTFKMPNGFLDIPTAFNNAVEALRIIAGKRPGQNPLPNRVENQENRRPGGPGSPDDRNSATPKAVDSLKGKIADDLDATKNALAAASGKTTTATTAGAQRVTQATYAGANTVAQAVRSAVPTVNVYNNISGVSLQQKTTVVSRAGKTGGDRVQDGSGVTHNGADYIIRFWFRNDDGDLEEFTERVNLAESVVQLVTQAEQGSVGSCTIVVDDPLGDWTISGHRWVYVLEDEADPEMLYWGYALQRDVSRSAPNVLQSRKWTITVTDINTLLARRIMVGSDCNRPAETDVERLQWLVATSEQNFIFDTSFLDTSNPVDMDAVDYRYQYASQIYDDCSQASGKNWFVYPVLDGSTNKVGFWYANGTDSTDYSSAIKISNDQDDIDYSTTFQAKLDTTLTRDPSRVYSGVSMPYDGGTVYQQNATTIDDFANRDTSAPMVNVKSNTKANARATRYLLTINTEEDVIETGLYLPPEQVNDVLAGQRIEAKFSHLPGYEDFSWMRVLKKQTTFLTPWMYDVDLTLSSQPASPVPFPIPGDTNDGLLCSLLGYVVPLDAGTGDLTAGVSHCSRFAPYTGSAYVDFGQIMTLYVNTSYTVYTYDVVHGPEAPPIYILVNNSSVYQIDLGDDEPFGPPHPQPGLLSYTGTLYVSGTDGDSFAASCFLGELSWTGHGAYDSEHYTVISYVSGPDPRFEDLEPCPDPTWTPP